MPKQSLSNAHIFFVWQSQSACALDHKIEIQHYAGINFKEQNHYQKAKKYGTK
jgi:hypothetical protein